MNLAYYFQFILGICSAHYYVSFCNNLVISYYDFLWYVIITLSLFYLINLNILNNHDDSHMTGIFCLLTDDICMTSIIIQYLQNAMHI